MTTNNNALYGQNSNHSILNNGYSTLDNAYTSDNTGPLYGGAVSPSDTHTINTSIDNAHYNIQITGDDITVKNDKHEFKISIDKMIDLLKYFSEDKDFQTYHKKEEIKRKLREDNEQL